MNEFKVGLVLSGGGAKGAYHVGMLKALNELGVQVDAIAGASIGSLNGAVLACAPTLKVGVERLENLWNTLANTPPLKANIPAYFNLLLKAGLHFSGADTAVKILARLGGGALANDGLMSDDPLKELINEYLDETQLAKGIPLFVSVYKGANSLETYMDLAVASLGIKDTQNSKFIHIQSLDRVEQKNALLASAAIPLLFAPKKVNGVTYQDGGIGGWQKMQGNTPITPLLDFGIKNIIVNHLSDGSLWDRHDFPDATVIEIRPKKPIERDGFMDLLGFKPENISSWIKQGYEDTMHCVGRIMKATRAHHEMYQSSLALQDSVKLFSEPNQELEKAKKRLQDLSC